MGRCRAKAELKFQDTNHFKAVLWYMELPTAAAVMLSSKSKYYCKDQVKNFEWIFVVID